MVPKYMFTVQYTKSLWEFPLFWGISSNFKHSYGSRHFHVSIYILVDLTAKNMAAKILFFQKGLTGAKNIAQRC